MCRAMKSSRVCVQVEGSAAWRAALALENWLMAVITVPPEVMAFGRQLVIQGLPVEPLRSDVTPHSCTIPRNPYLM